jgi:DNA polymerase-2
MVFWIKQRNGKTVRLEDKSWNHSIYVASDDKRTLNSVLTIDHKNIGSLIKEREFTLCYEKITDKVKSEVLKLTLSDSTKALTLAERIVRLANDNMFGRLRLYNVDLSAEQSYLYEQDIFPLAFSKVSTSSHSKLSWILKDNVWSTDYEVPDFKVIRLKVNLKREVGKIPKYTDRTDSILITRGDSETIEIQNKSEGDILEELVKIIKSIDPDFIFTEDGDSFTFPYLLYRSERSGINLILGREPAKPLNRPKTEGISYFSYGRIYFKPTTIKLLGRIHVDINNSFIWNDSGLQGLCEIARICRMPLHTASRASIGKCLSSLQFYYARQKEILVPWKPMLAEHSKTFEEMLVADRGGFIFEPEIGVHENVAEFDFLSLYPNIMLKKNLSAETIHCDCCKDSKLRVPELGYHICEKRSGIVPTSLRIVLEKRATYKKLLKNFATADPQLKAIYDSRQNSLKWILVTSFGYLGFNNAKFGRIDAHIAVCAFDRQILLQAAQIAERHGFRVLHGIVDSIWLRKRDTITAYNENDNDDYLDLKSSIVQKIGFTISFEGIFKWIVFVRSKINSQLPVPNRYFGIFGDGSLKIRGIEARRHDTPPYFSKCQNEILELMARGNNINEVKGLMGKVVDTFHNYVQLLKDKKVPLEELVFTKRLSRNSNEYQSRNTVEKNAIMGLSSQGKSLRAGEILQYVITDYYQSRSGKMRAAAIELINKEASITYDVRRYAELLAESLNSVTEPFECKLIGN